MINKIRLAFLAVALGAGVASTDAAVYNGNLIIGFSDGVGDDLAYDLGSVTSITNGQVWDLNSLLGSFTLSTVNWGVVGNSLTAGSGRKVYTTRDTVPSTVTAGSATGINTADSAIYQPFTVAGTGQSVSVSPLNQNSWNQQTINPTLSTQYRNIYGNPNAVGIVSINIWQATANASAPVLIGSFSLAADGKVTFTAASTAPPAPTLSIIRTGTTSSISFLSVNSATYTLYFTNSTGLATSVSNWPSAVGTIAGDGTTKTFVDVTTDTNRFYRVKAQ